MNGEVFILFFCIRNIGEFDELHVVPCNPNKVHITKWLHFLFVENTNNMVYESQEQPTAEIFVNF